MEDVLTSYRSGLDFSTCSFTPEPLQHDDAAVRELLRFTGSTWSLRTGFSTRSRVTTAPEDRSPALSEALLRLACPSAQAVLAALDEPHAVHRAVEQPETHGRQVGRADMRSASRTWARSRGATAFPDSWPSPQGSAAGSRRWAALCPCPCVRGPYWAPWGIAWVVPRGGLGREGVEGPALGGRLLLQEAPRRVLRRRPLQLLVLLTLGAPLLLVGLHLRRSLLLLLVLVLSSPMIDKTAHSIGPSWAPSLMEVVSGCLCWRNFHLLHGRYYLLGKENKDNNNKVGLFSSCAWEPTF